MMTGAPALANHRGWLGVNRPRGFRMLYLVRERWSRGASYPQEPREGAVRMVVEPAGAAVVQNGSTATHPDAGGRAGTREDGDLHGWTRVDVLPPGMQEVSGSSPLSSTWSEA